MPTAVTCQFPVQQMKKIDDEIQLLRRMEKIGLRPTTTTQRDQPVTINQSTSIETSGQPTMVVRPLIPQRLAPPSYHDGDTLRLAFNFAGRHNIDIEVQTRDRSLHTSGDDLQRQLLSFDLHDVHRLELYFDCDNVAQGAQCRRLMQQTVLPTIINCIIGHLIIDAHRWMPCAWLSTIADSLASPHLHTLQIGVYPTPDRLQRSAAGKSSDVEDIEVEIVGRIMRAYLQLCSEVHRLVIYELMSLDVQLVTTINDRRLHQLTICRLASYAHNISLPYITQLNFDCADIACSDEDVRLCKQLGIVFPALTRLELRQPACDRLLFRLVYYWIGLRKQQSLVIRLVDLDGDGDRHANALANELHNRVRGCVVEQTIEQHWMTLHIRHRSSVDVSVQFEM